MRMSAKIRLFVEPSLGEGQSVSLTKDQVHYVFNVMRLENGDLIRVFNGKDGEWLAKLDRQSKRSADCVLIEQTALQKDPPDLWLVFAPIKKARTDFIVEKATELGVAKIQPVLTEFTNSERVKLDRLQAHAIEAAEQCEGTFVPLIEAPQKLATLLDHWPDDRKILFCNEALAGGQSVASIELVEGPWAILIGPEGGFSQKEIERLSKMPQTQSVGLGPRILRADTAVVTAISLWQSKIGDWT